MKPTIVTSLGVIVAVVIQLLPSTPNVTTLVFNSKEPINKMEPVSRIEMDRAEAVPVYCADYIPKYGWNDTVAHNVMMIESGNKARNLNDNPQTGDYSVGCFQINLLGGNLMSKYGIMKRLGYSGPAERDAMKEWLWQPGNNVAVAWELYKSSGWGPWSFTTCKKIACY